VSLFFFSFSLLLFSRGEVVGWDMVERDVLTCWCVGSRRTRRGNAMAIWGNAGRYIIWELITWMESREHMDSRRRRSIWTYCIPRGYTQNTHGY
jgi:hypothetical protein